MIDLSKYRLKEFYLARLSVGEANEELLHECTYYPRPAGVTESMCKECSFEEPLKSCQYSHILRDTRIGPTISCKPKESKPRKKKGLVERLSEEDLLLAQEFVREKKKGER